MKFIVSSSALLKQLQQINGVINTNTVLPILEDFLFEIEKNKLTVVATDLAARGAAVLVISQDLDELAEIADRIAVMFHGRLSGALSAAEASREKLGLLMGGSSATAHGASEQEVGHAAGA